MGAQTKITITHDKAEVSGDLQSKNMTSQNGGKQHLWALQQLLNRVAMVDANAIVATTIDNGDAVSATGVATIGSSGSSTALVAGDILLVNGIAFTAVASGATGNQFNVGANDGASAANLAAAINASSSVAITGLFTAAAVANVVTVTCVAPGLGGNDYDMESRGSGSIVVTGAGAQASGTLTFNTAGAAADTLTINGVVFTAVASGATGNQYNVAGTAALTAANAQAAINASVTAGVLGYVYASLSGAIVTIKASRVGTFGNEFTLSAGQASITASGARLAGGTDNAVVNFTGGLAPTNPMSVSYKFGM